MTHTPDPETLAKQRYAILSMTRLIGVGLVILGILVTRQIIAWPEILGYILIAVGLFDVFFFPAVLARKWRSDRR